MEFVLLGCHWPGQWPLISWKHALWSGGGSQRGQGTQTKKGRVHCWQVQSCSVAHGWPSAGTNHGRVRGCHSSNDGKTSGVQATASCHTSEGTELTIVPKASGFILILQR